ncbi:hypothetical protein V4886_02375, partial [Ralstonia solanacearum species complex bacterium RW470]|uniref:hypothetical protein n=1 Tax=Ralstonia solanacearum species complex bacterium RW470 TaxID=3119580 RepID=UPI002FC355C3
FQAHGVHAKSESKREAARVYKSGRFSTTQHGDSPGKLCISRWAEPGDELPTPKSKPKSIPHPKHINQPA